LLQLLRRRVELQAAAAPLTKRLHRCNAALEDDDKAQALRDRLMDQHERMVRDCLEYGRHAPPMDPELNIAEIQLRKASGEARAAAKARAGIIEELDAITAQFGQLGLQLLPCF
jgi:hypothetical protein